MCNHALKKVIAERLHAYVTASPHHPADGVRAFEDGKRRFISTLTEHIEIAGAMSLDDFCTLTGAEQ